MGSAMHTSLQEGLVGRDKELEYFQHQLLLPLRHSARHRVVAIEGESGVGKSALLRRYYDLVGGIGAVRIRVDLKSMRSGKELEDMIEFMRWIRGELAQADLYLPDFSRALAQYDELDNLLGREEKPSKLSYRFMTQTRARSPDPRPEDRHTLLTAITGSFDLSELETLCFKMGIDVDNLRGQTMEGKARELILHLIRRQAITLLFEKDWFWPPDHAVDRRRAARGAALRIHRTYQATVEQRDYVDYVIRKLEDPDKIQFFLNAEYSLTRLLLFNINNIRGDNEVFIFLDGYERASQALDQWLHELMFGQYAEWTPPFRIVIAGRLPKASYWSSEGVSVRHVALRRFAQDASREYLRLRGITDNEAVDLISRLCDGLPHDLAAITEDMAEKSIKPGKDEVAFAEVVIRFISGQSRRQTELRRRAVLNCALPRQWHEEVLSQFVEEDAESIYAWLSGRTFVEHVQNDGWRYHERMREMILQLKREKYPAEWALVHGRLASYYEQQRDTSAAGHQTDVEASAWRIAASEALYHRLCQSATSFSRALNEFLSLLEQPGSRKPEYSGPELWANIIREAGKDTGNESMQRWGQRLLEGLEAIKTGSHGHVVGFFTGLLQEKAVEAQWRAKLLAYRGSAWRHLGRYREAEMDLSKAIDLQPALPGAYTILFQLHMIQENYSKALSDCNAAISLTPEDPWAYINRGTVYEALGEKSEAVKDYDQAIYHGGDLWVAYARAGRLKLQLGEYESAKTDLTSAIESSQRASSPSAVDSLVERGEVHRLLGQFDLALDDFNKALALDHDSVRALVERAETYRQMEWFEESLSDFDQASEIQTGSFDVLLGRGQVQLALGKLVEALTDVDRALSSRPNAPHARRVRGQILMHMGRFHEAASDLNIAIEAGLTEYSTFAIRGETFRVTGQYEQALDDFNHVLVGRATDDWCLYNRALVYMLSGKTDPANADLALARQISEETHLRNPRDWSNAFNCALYRLITDEGNGTLQLYSDALDQGATRYSIRTAIYHLQSLLHSFPDTGVAQEACQLLRTFLARFEG